MGNRIFSVDMLLNDFIRPINEAYKFHDFKVASNLLYQLNAFFTAFGCAVKNIIEPKVDDVSYEAINNEADYYKIWYEYWSPMVLAKIGSYIKQELTKVIDDNED